MPVASNMILNWIHEDGYSLSEAGGGCPTDVDGSGHTGASDLAVLLGS